MPGRHAIHALRGRTGYFWTGGFTDGDYRIEFRNADGRPVPGVKRQVENEDGRDLTRYVVAPEAPLQTSTAFWRFASGGCGSAATASSSDLVMYCFREEPEYLLGADYLDEYPFRSGARDVLCVHGDAWDNFLTDHPVISVAADWFYLGHQRMSKRLALSAKRQSKTFLRCAQKIEEGATEHARKKGCAVVCCGHSHHADVRRAGQADYYNSGCWTETPCTYLGVTQGHVELRRVGVAEEKHPEMPSTADPARKGLAATQGM